MAGLEMKEKLKTNKTERKPRTEKSSNLEGTEMQKTLNIVSSTTQLLRKDLHTHILLWATKRSACTNCGMNPCLRGFAGHSRNNCFHYQ